MGEVVLEGVTGELLDELRPAQGGGSLEGPEPDVAMAQPHQDSGPGRAGFVLAHKGFPSLHQGQGPRGGNPQGLQHGRGEDLAHAALQGESAVTAPGPGRDAGPLGPEIKQSARSGLAQLGEGETPTVAKVRVVNPELVAVVPLRQRRIEVIGKRCKTSEVAGPLVVGQVRKPHCLRCTVVPEPQADHREVCGPDRIGKVPTQGLETGIGPIDGRKRHAADMAAGAHRRKP